MNIYNPRFSLLCALFGHKSLENTYSGGEYMKIKTGAVDGIRRMHCDLYARCPRCQTEYRAGRLHVREGGEYWIYTKDKA